MSGPRRGAASRKLGSKPIRREGFRTMALVLAGGMTIAGLVLAVFTLGAEPWSPPESTEASWYSSTPREYPPRCCRESYRQEPKAATITAKVSSTPLLLRIPLLPPRKPGITSILPAVRRTRTDRCATRWA